MTVHSRLLCGLAICVFAAPLATASGTPLPLAHSAQIAIDVTPGDQTFVLHIRRAQGGAPLVSDDVTATVEGKSVAAPRQSDGSYLLPVDLRDGTEVSLDVVVAHDGIRELLSGKVTLPQESRPSAWAEHKQMAWWVLNIGVVLVAAIALSRRGGSSDNS